MGCRRWFPKISMLSASLIALYLALGMGAIVWDAMVPGIPANAGPGWLGLASWVVLVAWFIVMARDNPDIGGYYTGEEE